MKNTVRPKKRFVQIEELTEEQRTSIDEALIKHRIELDDVDFHLLIVGVENGLCSTAFFLNKELRENERGLRSRNDAGQDIEKLRSALSGLSDAAHGILSDAYEHTPTAKAFHEARVSTHIDSLRLFEEVANNLEEDPFQVMGFFGLIKNAMIEACVLAQTQPPPKVFDYAEKKEIDIVSRHTNKAHRPKGEIWEGLVCELALVFQNRTGRKATATAHGPFDDFFTACRRIIEPDWDSDPTKARSNRKLIRSALAKMWKPKTGPKTTRK